MHPPAKPEVECIFLITIHFRPASAKRGAMPLSETGPKAEKIIITSIMATAITNDSLLLNNTSWVPLP
jgi:hypothetical protein